MAQRKFYISAKRLRANDACPDQVELFERTFAKHKKVALTDENFEKAIKAELQIWWLADRYLGSAAYSAIEGYDFGEDYEPSARRYWRHIKAKLRKDTTVRPPEWYL